MVSPWFLTLRNSQRGLENLEKTAQLSPHEFSQNRRTKPLHWTKIFLLFLLPFFFDFLLSKLLELWQPYPRFLCRERLPLLQMNGPKESTNYFALWSFDVAEFASKKGGVVVLPLAPWKARRYTSLAWQWAGRKIRMRRDRDGRILEEEKQAKKLSRTWTNGELPLVLGGHVLRAHWCACLTSKISSCIRPWIGWWEGGWWAANEGQKKKKFFF